MPMRTPRRHGRSAQHFLLLRIGMNIMHQRAINLHQIDRQPGQMLHTGMARAKIIDRHLATELARMVEWLQLLPKPVGLLAFDSVQARQVTESCHLANIDVPPYETNGRGTPVTGMMPRVIATFWNTCQRIIVNTPAHR